MARKPQAELAITYNYMFKTDTGANATCIIETVCERMHYKLLLARNHENIITVTTG